MAAGGIPPNFEFILDFIVVLVTCKNEKDLIKNKGSRVLKRFSPLSLGFFSNAQGQLTPQYVTNFELIRDYIVVLPTCKNAEDPIKNEGARVLTSL